MWFLKPNVYDKNKTLDSQQEQQKQIFKWKM